MPERSSSHDAPSRPQHSGDERGIVLVMALLVMLILAVVVVELWFSSTVDLQRSENQVLELQMEKVAEAALLKAHAILVMDVEDDTTESDEGGIAPDGGTGGEGAPGGADAGGSLGGASGGQLGAHVDSLDEGWAVGDQELELGYDAGLTTRILIEDEDRKLNLLLLLTEPEEYRLEWRDRIVRALDRFREGKPGDLGPGDADEMVSRFEKWMEGDRRSDDLQIPSLASGAWRVEGRSQEVYAPLSLEELMLSGGIDAPLLYGYQVGEQEDRAWVPGLTRIFTVWSNLKYVEKADAEAQAEANAGQDPEEPPKTEAKGVNNGRINVNTSPIEVLRSLMPDHDLPAAAWEEYREFRELRLQELAEEADSFFGEEEDEDLDDPDEPVYPLETVDDLRRFEGFSESSGIDPDVWKLLRSILAVESNVFTVVVVVATVEPPTRYYVARSVVWRRGGSNGPEVVPVTPFEVMPPSAVDLSRIDEDLEEWSWDN